MSATNTLVAFRLPHASDWLESAEYYTVSRTLQGVTGPFSLAVMNEKADPFADQIERIRASGVLGRSHGLSRLFDYIAEKSAAGVMLREIDIAQDVFGRSVDVPGDASVRVYIHRLRKKIDQFYEDEGRTESARLAIPVGEYRLILSETVPALALPGSVRPLLQKRWAWVVAAGLLLAVNAGAWMIIGRQTAPARALAQVADLPLWHDLARNRPALVVIGDYYIFGDTNGYGVEPMRMVREFDVNSPSDLENYLMANPNLQGRYVDMDTYYTPVGATMAMREIMPLVHQAAGDDSRVRIITASQLTPDMMKSADIVYVGYLSALGILRDPVFAKSRFKIGESFDEVIDSKTKKSYISVASDALGDQANRDYGYLAVATGPSGNRIIVIAGTRDIGVVQTAQIAADPKALKALDMQRGSTLSALYEVQGVGRTNLSYRLVGSANDK